MSKPTPADRESSPVRLLLALTFSTGVVDAVGYLGLDRVFTGNMTGNVVILGMALVGSDSLPVLGPVVALAGFMAGAVLSGRALRAVPAAWSPRSSLLLAVVAALLLVTAAVAGEVPSGGDEALALTVGLGVAMGMQAQVARHLAVKDVTTVVVTSTLTGLAADSWLGGRTGQPWQRRAGAVALILAGAATGAALVQVGIWAGALASGLITVAVAVRGHTTLAR